MKNGARCGAMLLACLAAASASAQTAPAASQGARWHLDGATNRCVLTRQLQGTSGAATFVLRTIPGSKRYDVILAGDAVTANIPRGSEARLGFAGSSGTFQGATSAVELPGNLGRGVALGPLPPAFVAEFARASELRISDAEGRELGSWTVPVGARAAEALAFCENEKQVEWGADPAAFEPGATPPSPTSNPSTWLTMRDFGLTNTLAPAAYTAVFRLVLDNQGRPSECTLLEFAGNVDVEDDFCRALVHSARYTPARDPRGNPVRSVAVEIVSFRMTTDFRIIGG